MQTLVLIAGMGVLSSLGYLTFKKSFEDEQLSVIFREKWSDGKAKDTVGIRSLDQIATLLESGKRDWLRDLRPVSDIDSESAEEYPPRFYADSPDSHDSMAGQQTDSPPGTIQLDPPMFSLEEGTYPIAHFNLPLVLTNPNPPGSSAILFATNDGAWRPFSDEIAIGPDDQVRARVKPNSPEYAASRIIEHTYLASPATLAAPVIFHDGPFPGDKVTVSISHLNHPKISRINYRVQDGSWTDYAEPFSLDSSYFRKDTRIEAKVIPTSPYYRESPVAGESIPGESSTESRELARPTIETDKPEFIPGAVESIRIRIHDSNDELGNSILRYRLARGESRSYEGPFTVDLATYSSGVLVETWAAPTSLGDRISEMASLTIDVAEPSSRMTLIDADADTSIAGNVPSWSGHASQLHCTESDPSQVLVHFDLTDDLSAPATVTSAIFYLTSTDQNGAGRAFPVHEVLPGVNWTGGEFTWRRAGNGLQSNGRELSQSPIDISKSGSVIPGVRGSPSRKVWDITTLVQKWVNRPESNNGIAILAPPGHREIFCPREHLDDSVRPKLLVRWTTESES